MTWGFLYSSALAGHCRFRLLQERPAHIWIHDTRYCEYKRILTKVATTSTAISLRLDTLYIPSPERYIPSYQPAGQVEITQACNSDFRLMLTSTSRTSVAGRAQQRTIVLHGTSPVSF